MQDVEVDENVEISLDIVPIGEVKYVLHSEWASHRQIEVEHRGLRAKMNKFKVVEEDKELDELFGDEDEEDDGDDKDDKDDKDKKDDKDDKDDDDDQGAIGLLITKRSGPSTLEDFLKDELNVGRGGVVENWSWKSMLEELDMDGGKLKFDIEEDIPSTPDREYTFKFVNEVENFHDVIIEEGLESNEDTPFHYSGVDGNFPTLNELFQSHNEDEVRRKVVEKITIEGCS
ncbi:hypothetical protein Hanom_Chr06g00563271 [Helianthus anomalus]